MPLLKNVVALFSLRHSILEKKNHDYAGNEDEYANFKRVERIGITVEQGIFSRFLDKVTRLERHFLTGKFHVTDENFDDTLIDAVNYLEILYSYRQDNLPPVPIVPKWVFTKCGIPPYNLHQATDSKTVGILDFTTKCNQCERWLLKENICDSK